MHPYTNVVVRKTPPIITTKYPIKGTLSFIFCALDATVVVAVVVDAVDVMAAVGTIVCAVYGVTRAKAAVLLHVEHQPDAIPVAAAASWGKAVHDCTAHEEMAETAAVK